MILLSAKANIARQILLIACNPPIIKAIKALIITSILSFAFSNIQSTTYYSVSGGGDWNSSSTWASSSGQSSGGYGVPGNNDIVYVESDVILDVDVGQPGIDLYITSDGSLTSKPTGGPYGVVLKTNGILDVSGDLAIDNLDVKNGVSLNLKVGGTINVTNLITGKNGGSDFTVDGDLVAGTIDNLTITGTGSVTATSSYTNTNNIYGTTSPVVGTTYYGQSWLGTSSTAWETSGNWASGSIPTSTTHVQIFDKANDPIIASNANCNDLIIESSGTLVINAGYSLTVSGDFTNKGTITLKSGSSGTASIIVSGSVSNSGTISIERYLTGSKYHYVSSPFADETVSSVEGSNPVYYYDETNTTADRDVGWTTASSASIMTAGRGYAVYLGPTTTKTMSGTLNNSNLTYSVSNTSSGTASEDGWNLIGNPYPAALDASLFVGHNSDTNSVISGTVNFWSDDGSGGTGYDRNADYAAWNSTSAVGASGGGYSAAPDGKIAVGQGFFVRRTASGSANIDFKRYMRVSNTSQFFTPEIRTVERCWINLTTPDSLVNEISFGFLPEATTGIDKLYDAEKLRGNTNVAFYSLLDDKEFIIQGLPLLESTYTVPVGFYSASSGIHKIRLEDLKDFPGDVDIYLYDRYYEISQKLKLGNAVSFYSDAGEFNDRFMIQFVKTAQGVDENKLKEEVILSSIEKHISIHNISDQGIGFSLHTTEGKEVISSFLESGKLYHSPALPKGIYLVKFQTKQYTFSDKVMIQ